MAKVAWLDCFDSLKGKVLVTIVSKEGIEKHLVKPKKPFTLNDGRQFIVKGKELVVLGGKG